MNLYCRLIILLLKLPWLPKQRDPLAPATLSMRVMPNDLDIYGHVNNGRYLTLMDLGRLHLLWITDLLPRIRKQKWSPLLGSAKIHFLKPMRVFTKFTLSTQTVYWDDKWFYLEQKIESNGKLYAVALLKLLFIDKERKIPPQDIIDLLPAPPACPPQPHVIALWRHAEHASHHAQR